MFGIGWTEILVILVVALLLLGPKRLPELAKGLGRGLRDFRKAMSGLDMDEPPDRTPPPPKPAPPEPPASPEPAPRIAPPATPSEPPPAEPTDAEPVETSRSGR